MSKKKKPQTLPELYAAKAEAEDELKKAKQREKILNHQISKLTRNARTHRLCTRAAMLEKFLQEPEVLTDDDVMELLLFIFHSEATQKKLTLLVEKRKKTLATEDGEI